jgi:hypothetical protein
VILKLLKAQELEIEFSDQQVKELVEDYFNSDEILDQLEKRALEVFSDVRACITIEDGENPVNVMIFSTLLAESDADHDERVTDITLNELIEVFLGDGWGDEKLKMVQDELKRLHDLVSDHRKNNKY